MSASPALLVAMLYDKAISSLKEATAAIANNEIERRWRCNVRATEIINHLLITLDMENGGEIAANLEKLYIYMLNRLPDIDLGNDPRPAKEVISLLEPFAKAWHTLDEQGVAADPAKAAALANEVPDSAEESGAPKERIAISA